MLDFAGVGIGDVTAYAERDEEVCEQVVALVYFFRKLTSRLGQGKISVLIYGDVSAAFQESDGAAYAWL